MLPALTLMTTQALTTHEIDLQPPATDTDIRTVLTLFSCCGVTFTWRASAIGANCGAATELLHVTIDQHHPRWSPALRPILQSTLPNINRYLRRRVVEEFGRPEPGQTYTFTVGAWAALLDPQTQHD